MAARLQELLGKPVRLAADCVGADTEALAQALAPGGVVARKLRFHPEEEANDPAFAQALARLGEVYVNDAFGAAHGRMRRPLGLRPICSQRWQDLLVSRRFSAD